MQDLGVESRWRGSVSALTSLNGRAWPGAATRQGAGVEELLLVFDKVRAEHERMDAGRFNDDDTYKKAINEVMKSDGWSGVKLRGTAGVPILTSCAR
jgi:hypothetical protein